MSGTLFICGTPIGNLEDMTMRQLRVLKEVDLVACEDTRHTVKIMNHYDIKNKLFSYHEHNFKSKGPMLADMLLEGKNIALVSDAGMPGICDPGMDLIRLCRERGIVITTVPGPSAAISAFVLSGIDSKGFVFEGFFPQENKERVSIIESLKIQTKAVIFYEAPHRLLKTLKILMDGLGGYRRAAVVREITKIHEQMYFDSISSLHTYFEANNPKGEIVLLVEGVCEKEIKKSKTDAFKELSIKEHMSLYTSDGSSEKEAMKLVAKDRGLPKRDIYNLLLKGKE